MFGIVIYSAGGLVFMLLWIWAVLDVISTDYILCRNLPKNTWLFLVIFVPTVGAIAWLVAGRPIDGDFSLGGQRSRPYEFDPSRPRPSVRGPEDDPSWNTNTQRTVPSSMRPEESLAIRERKLLEKEAEIAKREAELAAKADEGSADDGSNESGAASDEHDGDSDDR